jgi:GDP-4-dehydro-6-deoxy-D-mannose reductase
VILITGVGGFVGRHLAGFCRERGAELAGIGRGERPDLPELSAYERIDVTDAKATREAIARLRPEWVFHLAGEASVARSWEAPGDVIAGNVTGALNLLEAIRLEAPEAAVLMACSGEEYGPPQVLPVDESHPLEPQNPYATSKVMVDQLARFYADIHGLRVVRTRAFNHAGPGQSDTYVVGRFAHQIAQAEADTPPSGRSEISTGNLMVRRDFCDVRDVVRAYWMALESGETGVFNVCSGRSTAVSDILTALAALSSLDVECRIDPSRLRNNEVMEIRGSHEKLTKATGWQPEIELADTLRETLDWWRRRVAAGAVR